MDLGVMFQRGLREAEAWMETVKLPREYPLMTVSDFREANLLVVNDDCIEVWINSMRKPGVLLLIQQKVPCFVVYELPPKTLVLLSSVPNLPTFYNFVNGMDTMYLVWHNTYQLLVEELGRLDSLFHQEDGQGEHTVTDPQDEARLSSSYMTSLPLWMPSP
jgi:hypothetical protein